MDETFGPPDGIDTARLKALARRSNAKGLLRLAGHGALLAATGALVWLAGDTWRIAAMAAHGFVLIFLFAPLHETVHRTAFRSRWLNDTVAWVCGILLLLPPEYFRAFHFAHHRYTQDPARDPELAVPKPSDLKGYLLSVSGLPFWRERITTLLRHAAGRIDETFVAPRQRGVLRREARYITTIYGAVAAASVALESSFALTYWILPALIGQPALRLFLLAEHGGCPQVPEMLRNSRTTKSTALMRWLAWNMPHHAEHHAYPALPFHALPKAHEALRDRIAVRAPGYLAVHRALMRALAN